MCKSERRRPTMVAVAEERKAGKRGGGEREGKIKKKQK